MEDVFAVWIPTLQEMALIQVSAILWNSRDMRKTAIVSATSTLGTKLEPNWAVVQNTASKIYDRLVFPIALKSSLENYLTIVGRQVIKWINYHHTRLQLLSEKELPKQLKFDSQGLIDKKYIAEQLVVQKDINIRNRYKIACLYCLEVHIQDLYKRLEATKTGKLFLKRLSNADDRKQPILSILWTRINISQKENVGRFAQGYGYTTNFTDKFKDGVLSSVYSGNEVALRYFLKTPSPDYEWLSKLVDVTFHTIPINVYGSSHVYNLLNRLGYSRYVIGNRPYSFSSEYELHTLHYDTYHVFCYILSLMNAQQQNIFFRSYPVYVYRFLLDWPYLRSFVKVVGELWRDMRDIDKVCLLNFIMEVNPVDSPNIFNYFWQRLPENLQDYETLRVSKGFLLSLLQDERSLKLFLSSASEDFRKKLVFSPEGDSVWEELVYEECWNSIKLFIEECVMYSDTLVVFRERITEHIMLNLSHCCREKNQDMLWSNFFKFLGELQLKVREVDVQPQAKKLRIL